MLHFIPIKFQHVCCQRSSPPTMLLLRDFWCCVYFLKSQTKAGVDGHVGWEGIIKVMSGADQSALPCWFLFIIFYFTSWLMTDFQLLIWCGREVMGTSVSDAKGECVVVAMADTKSTHHPLLVVTMFGFFFLRRPLSLPPSQLSLRPLPPSLSFCSCCREDNTKYCWLLHCRRVVHNLLPDSELLITVLIPHALPRTYEWGQKAIVLGANLWGIHQSTRALVTRRRPMSRRAVECTTKVANMRARIQCHHEYECSAIRHRLGGGAGSGGCWGVAGVGGVGGCWWV